MGWGASEVLPVALPPFARKEGRDRRHANLRCHTSSAAPNAQAHGRVRGDPRWRSSCTVCACTLARWGTMRRILALRCMRVLSNVEEVTQRARVAEQEEEEGNLAEVSTAHEPLPYT